MDKEIRDVVKEWNALTPKQRADLFTSYPEFYFVAARLVRTAEALGKS